MGGWGSLLDRVTSWLPISGKIERIKNKISKLERERDGLLSKKATNESSVRLTSIESELVRLNGLLKNAAKD